MYLSRRLRKTEFNYSNTKKEALAILWTTTKARQFLKGKKILISDHRPLEFIFYPRKDSPKATTSRILRWAIRLMAFDFDIEYIKGNSIPRVDPLSRLRFYKEKNLKIHFHIAKTNVLSLDRMAAQTRDDPVLSRITSRIRKKHIGKLFQGG